MRCVFLTIRMVDRGGLYRRYPTDFLALWLQYDADGLIGVNGMQFRYFLPYAPLFAFVMLESGRRLLKQ